MTSLLSKLNSSHIRSEEYWMFQNNWNPEWFPVSVLMQIGSTFFWVVM